MAKVAKPGIDTATTASIEPSEQANLVLTKSGRVK
jgi:hypothetical protein